jgi:hypothetical protein
MQRVADGIEDSLFHPPFQIRSCWIFLAGWGERRVGYALLRVLASEGLFMVLACEAPSGSAPGLRFPGRSLPGLPIQESPDP